MLTSKETVSWLRRMNVTCFAFESWLLSLEETSLKRFSRDGQALLRFNTSLKLSLSLITSGNSYTKKQKGRVKEVVAERSLPP